MPRGADYDIDTFVNWYEDFIDSTEIERRDAQKDIDYYHGHQLSSDEIAEYRKRGQPPVIINMIAKQINFILGNEVKTRVMPKAFPRTAEHESDAQVVADVTSYIAEKEDFDIITSDVLKDMVIAGYAGAFIGAEIAKAAEGDDPPVVEVTARMLPYDRIWYDPRSSRHDFQDALYTGIVVWKDLDEAIAQYPGKKDELELAVNDYNEDAGETFDDKPRDKYWIDRERKRVKVCEVYYRGEDDDYYFAHFTKSEMLLGPKKTELEDPDGKSQNPMCLMSCYVDRDNRRYGVVRGMTWPQDEVNKRRSKGLHFMNTRQIIAEESALIDEYKTSAELSRPDGIVTVRDGALREGSFQIAQTTDLAQAHYQMYREAKGEIMQVGPSVPDPQGPVSGLSGTALRNLQNISSLELAPVRDRLRQFQRCSFEQMWYRARQFWTTERVIRVRDDEEASGVKFFEINQDISKMDRIVELTEKGVKLGPAVASVGAPPEVMQQIEAYVQQNPQLGEIPPDQARAQVMAFMASLPELQGDVKVNDLPRFDVDIVFSESPDYATVEMETFEKIMQLATSGMIQLPVEAVIEMAPLPNKKKVMAKLKPPPDPQQQAMIQQQMQQQQQQFQMQMAAMQAQIEKVQADAQKAIAGANKDMTQAALNVDELERGEAKGAKLMADAQKASVQAQTEALLAEPKAMLTRAEAAEEATRAEQQAMNNREQRAQNTVIVAKQLF